MVFPGVVPAEAQLGLLEQKWGLAGCVAAESLGVIRSGQELVTDSCCCCLVSWQALCGLMDGSQSTAIPP